MSDERWSDERIRDEVGKHSPYLVAGSIHCLSADMAAVLMEHVRNDYEARITELEAQLAQTWQPLPDGRLKTNTSIEFGVYGNRLNYYFGGPYAAMASLPDNIRLCRLVTPEPTP